MTFVASEKSYGQVHLAETNLTITTYEKTIAVVIRCSNISHHIRVCVASNETDTVLAIIGFIAPGKTIIVMVISKCQTVLSSFPVGAKPIDP